MSFFDFFRKPSTVKPMPDPSGLPSVPAQVQAGNRRSERHSHRELLYGVIRDEMIRAGVLAASYKFKVLSLDSRGKQYLIMMDLLGSVTPEPVHLRDIETLITQAAKGRHGIDVGAVYWRAAELAAKAPNSLAPSRSETGVPAISQKQATGYAGAYAPLQASEMAAFKQAHAATKERRSATAGPRRATITPDFEDTRMESASPLSVTQYGDLN